MGALYIGIITFIRIFQNFFNKRASEFFPKSAKSRYSYVALSMGLAALLGAVTLLIGKTGAVSLTCILLATASGLALALVKITSALSLKNGTMVMDTAFATAGLIVPCVAGIFFFDEPMTVWQWLGIGIFILGAFFLASYSRSACPTYSVKTVLYLIGTFLLNGITMLCQKLLTYLDANANVTMFSFLSFLIPAAIFFAAALFAKDKSGEKPDKRLYLPTVVHAAAVFLINQLVTLATKYVPSVVLFTFLSGGNTVVSFVIATLCYKEKPNYKAILGLVLTLGGILIINALK